MTNTSAARSLRVSALFICFLSMAHAGTVALSEGSITITDTVTQIGSLYQYNYTVADGTGQLALFDIAVSLGVPISGLTAPGGSSAFTSTVDTVGSGSSEREFVSFLENNGTFSTAPESGFIFDSPVAPRATTFDVTLFDGNAGVGSGITGPVVPEPSSLALFMLGGATLLFLRKRAIAFRAR